MAANAEDVPVTAAEYDPNLGKLMYEDETSWSLHMERLNSRRFLARSGDSVGDDNLDEENNGNYKDGDDDYEYENISVAGRHFLRHRELKHKHSKEKEVKEKLEKMAREQGESEELRVEEVAAEDRADLLESETELLRDSGVKKSTVHGMMIDAGSTGSRIYVYEYEPRTLFTPQEIQDALTGEKLSFPLGDSRWTQRLHPGLATYADIQDDTELEKAVAEYLSPLIEFAKIVLNTKRSEYGNFPIYLKATGGFRKLSSEQRSRLMGAVRRLFNNSTFSPFWFPSADAARVISGEEEAIYGWTAVNFLRGNLLSASEGSGAVNTSPQHTVGALDLGGSSTQISFYDADIMENLYKLQIGQGKHWNAYATSFLRFGVNDAMDRIAARLVADKSAKERLEGVYNPCLFGDSSKFITSITNYDSSTGMETDLHEAYSATLINDGKHGDFKACQALTRELLHTDGNALCEFVYPGACSFAGRYQPSLPSQESDGGGTMLPEKAVGEFVGFSNFYHVWKFLGLPERATMAELHHAAEKACSMSHKEAKDYNHHPKLVDKEDLVDYCFLPVYVYELLHTGYGFGADDYVSAVHVLGGHKVTWALGSMLYEINTLPWDSSTAAVATQGAPRNVMMRMTNGHTAGGNQRWRIDSGLIVLVMAIAMTLWMARSWKNFVSSRPAGKRCEYEPLKDAIQN